MHSKRRGRVFTFKASNSGGKSVIDLCEVDHDGSQVTRGDRVIAISCISPIEGVMPFCSDLRTSRYGDDGVRQRSTVRVDSTVANDVLGGYIRDRLPCSS